MANDLTPLVLFIVSQSRYIRKYNHCMQRRFNVLLDVQMPDKRLRGCYADSAGNSSMSGSIIITTVNSIYTTQ